MSDITATVEKLCAASRKDYASPYDAIDWPDALDKEQWFMSPELISIYGTPIWENLAEPDRKRLSFFECANFFSLNIHGEKPLVEGLAQRLYKKNHLKSSPYLHHFLDEENKHMIYFGGFLSRYAGKVYPDRKVAFARDYAEGEEDFLFFVKVLIFEEIVDVLNVRMSLDERLHPLARRINALHHKDEARHLVFGRQIVKDLFAEYSPRWSTETHASLEAYLAQYLISTWKEYYNPTVYKDSGLADPYDVFDQAFTHPATRTHRKEVSASCLKFLLGQGMLKEAPVL